MPDLTNKDALLEKIVELTNTLAENIPDVLKKLKPVGCVQAFAGSTTPDGWLLCDGSAVSRTDYADLYAVIGDTYGAGDGSTTFNLPNLVDKFVEGSTTAGTEKSAGLPNIKGKVLADPSSLPGTCRTRAFSGAFNKMGSGSVDKFTRSGIETADYGITFSASDSNSIYSDSVTTVQPPALTMRYVIKF